MSSPETPPQETPTTPLLPSPPPPPSSPSPHLHLSSLLFLSSLVLFLFSLILLHQSSSSPQPQPQPTPSSRPLTNLTRPAIILLSADGFRFDYHLKSHSPNLHSLITHGTSTTNGLIPVFPSLTFPNHYSIATGLFPSHHGIVNNRFLDPNSGRSFFPNSTSPEFWLGEPIWETVSRHGLNAATYFWPGSEVVKGAWTCPTLFCHSYNKSVAFEDRVDTVLSYFDLPGDQIPVFTAVYFEEPDEQGHRYGPDHPKIDEAVERVDGMIGRLVSGLRQRGVFEDVSILFVGDHGMAGTCGEKNIFLEDFDPWIRIPKYWVESYGALLAIRPPDYHSPADVVYRMNQALSSELVENGEYLKLYLKEELPQRLHYWDNDRIPPIIGLVAEGYRVEIKRTDSCDCGGAHGYDNALLSMRTMFVAHGPQFGRGVQIPSFQNIEIYNVITSILKLDGAPNNGSASFPNSVLLPGY